MRLWIAPAILAAVIGCSGEPAKRPDPPPSVPAPPPPTPPPPAPAPAPPPVAPEPEAEPDRIRVQHVLIAFVGASRAPDTVTRTRAEAETLAKGILERVKKGEDIAKLAGEYSTDPGGGRYTLVNHGVGTAPDEIKRAQFIKPFSDVAFKLKVGEAGLVDHDSKAAPFGWHIIKRLE